jgi:hypothetical protein
MEVGRIRWLIEGGRLADVDACRAELVAITSVRAMLAQRELRVTQRLDELSADTEGELATHTKGTASKAGTVRRRKQAVDDVPQLGAALAEGETHRGACRRGRAGVGRSVGGGSFTVGRAW